MNRSRTWWIWRAAAAAVVLLISAGCASSFSVTAPPGFVVLEDQEPDFAYRAATADGVVIAVREIEHEPKGDLAFWVKAIENRLRDRGGYALLSAKQVATKQGLKGKRLTFGHDEAGSQMRYDLTIFVTDDKIYLLEFGGPTEQLEKLEPRLQWVLDNFQLT